MTALQAQAGLLPSLKWGVKGGMDYQVNDFKSAADNIDIKSKTTKPLNYQQPKNNGPVMKNNNEEENENTNEKV